jgi:hypothetical protein
MELSDLDFCEVTSDSDRWVLNAAASDGFRAERKRKGTNLSD